MEPFGQIIDLDCFSLPKSICNRPWSHAATYIYGSWCGGMSRADSSLANEPGVVLVVRLSEIDQAERDVVLVSTDTFCDGVKEVFRGACFGNSRGDIAQYLKPAFSQVAFGI